MPASRLDANEVEHDLTGEYLMPAGKEAGEPFGPPVSLR
jgi:hypothetical protein